MYQTNVTMAEVMTEEDVPNTTFLKWVVIILGILIIGVASAIGIILYKRATADVAEPEKAVVQEISPTVSSVPSVKFGDVQLEAPAGMSAIGVTSSGGRLLVTYGPDPVSPRLVIVVRQQTGEVLGRITLQK